jgi:RND family efflux transporter MFP subunit
MNASVDLRQLAVHRDAPSVPPSRRRHLLARYVLPGALLAGFLGVLGWSGRDSFLSSKPVTVAPVLTTLADVQQGGAPLFPAAGWVEPRPTPVLVTALAEGVVGQLLVVEGQEVKAGEPVARLIDADAQLVLRGAQADVRLRAAELSGAKGVLTAARILLAQPVQLRAELAGAEATLAKTETDLGGLPYQIRAAEARAKLARQDLEGKNKIAASGALPDLVQLHAQNDLDAATVALEELKSRDVRLKKEIDALKAKAEALRQRLELKTEENRQLSDAEAGVQVAEARLEQARVAVEKAKLCLQRMTVLAPAGGRVLALVARPGMRVMGLSPGSMHDASTVVSLYDPAQLQVRADVRLEDLPRVQPGQQVQIETPAVTTGPLEGEVLFATSQADIQKNTLQVKVAVKAPPPVLKPDMLVQVTFLAPPQPNSPPDQVQHLRLLVPRGLVETADGGARVWVADQVAGVARRRTVQTGAGTSDGLVEVVEGLTAGDKLIVGGREDLRDGERIRVTGEDEALGTSALSGGTGGSRLSRLPGNQGKH